MLADALTHLVQGIVSHPEDVRVRSRELRTGNALEVRVHPDDVGKVIGRQGRTATAIRTVVGALAGQAGTRVDFVDVEHKPARSAGRTRQFRPNRPNTRQR
ncbi:MAG: RNA-binding protein [Propionibacteriaceae bacterium]|jgi:predicted RNA-binding protein YlqC (UPF0109 family)|nr:RNA-binding protein [Propionibacteriaceae bacterium]